MVLDGSSWRIGQELLPTLCKTWTLIFHFALPGFGQVGFMGGGHQGHSPHPQGCFFQRDHRAHCGHREVHIPHGHSCAPWEAVPLCGTHWNWQELLHQCEYWWSCQGPWWLRKLIPGRLMKMIRQLCSSCLIYFFLYVFLWLMWEYINHWIFLFAKEVFLYSSLLGNNCNWVDVFVQYPSRLCWICRFFKLMYDRGKQLIRLL